MNNYYQDYKKLLTPEFISKIKGLDLKAKYVVEGFLIGLHKSPYHGFSVEFSEYRPYMAGDEISKIDWKLFAKTDKYFTKQYEEETNLRASILIDKSKSMSYTSGLMTKYQYATILSAALTYLMINQKDAVGLTLYSNQIEKYLPPKATKKYMLEILKTLSETTPSESTDTATCLKLLAERIKKRSLIIIISDFMDDTEAVISAIKQFKVKKNEIIVFQILDEKEVSFNFSQDSVFRDLESGDELLTLPYQIKKSYKEAFNEFQKSIESECKNNKIDYNLILTNQSFDKALLSYLIKRKKLV